MILTQREGSLTVVCLECDTLSGIEHATLGLVPGDAVGRGKVTLRDGHLGAQGKGSGVAVALTSLDGRLVGLVNRRIGVILQRGVERVLEVLRVFGELAVNLLGHRECLVRVRVGGRTKTHHLRDGGNLLAGHVEFHGVGELTDDVGGALGALDASRNLDDRRLVRRNLREGHSQLLGRALDRRTSAEGTLRGVLAQALTLGRGRIDNDEGVLLDVVDHGLAGVAPFFAGGNLVDNRRASYGGIASRQDHTPDDGLVLIAIFVLTEGQPAVLLVARNTGGAAQHVDFAIDLLAQLDRVLLTAGTGVAGQTVGGHMAIPLRGGLDLLVEDDGHHAVSSQGAATNDDTVVGDDLKLPGNVRAQDALPRRNVDDRGVVGEVVAGLYAAVGLPRQLNAEVPPVAHSRGLTTGVVDELSVVPIQGDLVAHIRGRLGAAQGAADAGA